MKQVVKNKNNQKTKAGAALVDFYCEDTLTKSHAHVDLTPHRIHGLTTSQNYLRDIAQVKTVYLHQRRFKPGARLRILNDWQIITDAPGVLLSPTALQQLADMIYRTGGPGIIGKYNEHVKQAADKTTGIVPGPDGNYRMSSVRRLGPFLLRRRDNQKSEYRMLKVANEVVRLKLQDQENIYFPDTDAKREAARKQAKKLLRSEELALDEWNRLKKRLQADGGDVNFNDSTSLLKNTDSARQVLKSRGYEFTARKLPAGLAGDSNPFAHHLFTITHPDWVAKRVKNAKKPIPSKSRAPECSVDLLVYLAEARQLVREYHRQHLADLEKAKTQPSPAEASAPIPAPEATARPSVSCGTPDKVTPPAEPSVAEAPIKPAPVQTAPAAVSRITINTATNQSALVEEPGFRPDNYLVPEALIKAVEGLDRPLMRNVQEARQLLDDIGWPVAKETPKSNELILSHGGQVVRLPLDETLCVIQLALYRAKLYRDERWTKDAETILGVEPVGDLKPNTNCYLDPFHSSIFGFERQFEAYYWIYFSKYIKRPAEPITALVKCCKHINDYSYIRDPERALQWVALHYRTNPCGFLSFISQVRRQFLGPDRISPPFVSPIAPPSVPFSKPLTTEIVTAHLINANSPGPHCIKNLEDFRNRLETGGFKMKQLDGDSIEISSAGYEPLTLNTAAFIIGIQRQILLRVKTASAGEFEPLAKPLDLDFKNANIQHSAPWNVPVFGKFWEVAEKICVAPATAKAFEKTIRISANIIKPDVRFNNILWWLEDEKIAAFEQFCLLQAHSGASLFVGSWMLGEKLKTSPDFKPEELGFTLTKAGEELRKREAEQALIQQKLQRPHPKQK